MSHRKKDDELKLVNRTRADKPKAAEDTCLIHIDRQ